MSKYVQIPNSLLKLSGRTKDIETYCYLLIRSQIKDDSYKSSISQNELMKLLNVSESSIKRYIKNLSEYFDSVTKKNGNNKFPYNVYGFNLIKSDYSIISPKLINCNLSADLKGLLIRIKLLCNKGTNHISFNSKNDLIQLLGIGKNQITGRLKELEQSNMLTVKKNLLILNPEYFPLSINNNGDSEQALKNHIFETIYNFCLKWDSLPLRDDKALGYLAAKFGAIDDSLKDDLKRKINKLPSNISLDYFVTALCNKDVIRRTKTNYDEYNRLY